jgi:acetylornithine deacetylase
MNALSHLEKLVSFDTQNPPRKITSDDEIFNYLSKHLSDFKLVLSDYGDGCISLLAIRGQPEILFNFHIDTVPISDKWDSNPLKLKLENSNAIGLGACDIKGAAACMLAAVEQTEGDVALLFTSDEEHGASVAVKAFLNTEHQFHQVIVAEPTNAKAILAHRGIQSAKAVFSGIPGHASEKRAVDDSAIHKAANWITASLEWVKQQTCQFESLTGLPFNIGKVEGGIKANMIAADCELSFGFRPLPGQNSKTLLRDMTRLAKNSKDIRINSSFIGPTLPAANQHFENAILKAQTLANHYDLPIGKAVDYWTEASLFSQAGITAVVYGPGNISQAHTINEWVSLEQLKIVENVYIKIINNEISNGENNDQ